ncbi:hypothetical protein [Roseovarius sp. MBR-154]|jgi:hypothetical protein
MRPNFALSLSFDGISLLHRAGPSGWHLVGEVALDCEDLSAELAALREKAAALDPSGLSTKLVIPDAQIRYLDLPASSAPYGDYDAAAAEALDGATPYALDDLAFDWNVEGARLYVAAVARETLEEAEAFATEHGFNPVSFVARPESDGFGTEPFFGETSHATEPVERDVERIEILGAAHLPEPKALDADKTDASQPPEAQDATETQVSDAGTSEAEGAPGAENDKPAASGVPAFASIRAERGADRSGAPKLTGAARGAPDVPAKTPSPAARETEATPGPGPAVASLAPLPEDSDRPGRAEHSGAISFFSRRADRAAPTGHAPEPVAAGTRATSGPTAIAAAPTGPGFGTPEDEAERMTIFGARDTQRAGRGKPRFLGLILTVVLLILLAGVAAWAAIFPESGLARLIRGSEVEIALTPDIPELAAPAETSPAPQTPAQEPATDPSSPDTLVEPEVALVLEPEVEPETDPQPQQMAAPEPVVEPAPETPGQEAAPSGPPTPEEARARYVVTGIWQLPPEPPLEPEAGHLDDFYLTSIDEDVPASDAVALPAAPDLQADARPATPAVPAPPGTEFTIDARGLVVATPEGALTPENVLVRAGPPPLIPPDMPTRAVPVPGLALTAEAAEELERLNDIRPRTRPTDLIEQQERGALGGRSRIELAGLRPRPRPEAIAQAAAATVAPDAVTAALAEAVEDAAPEPGATPQAVAASLKPQPRPEGFQRIVREAPQQTAAAATVAPRIPSSASVARSATNQNAINMRQVNLIGVYGSPSNRRALVRLANGRYQKVQVGDRMDGGQVSAIGDSELRYNKRGRDVVLRMPKG